MEPTVVRPARNARQRIIDATLALLTEGGREAVSTRSVSAAAGVQAPTIYRLFGDKQGLLDAVAAYGYQTYVDSKMDRQRTADPIEDLRAGWDLHVGFGLANPSLYALIANDPPSDAASLAAIAGFNILANHIHRIAEVGRLRVSEERAAHLVHAAGSGTTLALIAMPECRRDLALSNLAREAVIAAITTQAPVTAAPGPASAAVALRAVLPQTSALTEQEQGLLREWLDRIATVSE